MKNLTGRTRFRSSWRGKLVLQVQFFEMLQSAMAGTLTPGAMEWRDASTQDLAELQHLTFSRIEINVRLPDLPANFEPPRVVPPPSPTKH